MRVHIPSLQRNSPDILCTDHVMIEGGRIPSCLLTLTFLPKAPCLRVAFSPINVPSRPPSLPTDIPWPAGFPHCPVPARGLGTSPHYLGSLLDVLWKGLEGARQGGAGQALMQSRGAAGRGGCPRGGWSAAASAPAPEASPGTIGAGSGSLLGLLRALRPGGFT